MRKLKKGESNAWSTKKLSKIQNEKGQTLIDMMITVTIGLIVSAGIATVFVFAMQQVSQLIEKNETEQASLWTAYYLQKYISGATNVFAVSAINSSQLITIDANHNTTICPASASGDKNATDCGYGQFVYDFDAHNNLDGGAFEVPAQNGTYYTLAFFNREIGQPQGGSTPGSTIVPSGIFVRSPNLITDPNTTILTDRSYQIAFNTMPTTGGAVTMDPATSPLFYGRLHNIRVQTTDKCEVGGLTLKGYKVEVVRDSDGMMFNCIPLDSDGGFTKYPPTTGTIASAGEKYWIKTVTFETFFRYFKSNYISKFDYFFDGGKMSDGDSYNDGAPGATMPTSYRDIEQTITVNFDNNVLTTQSLTGGGGQPVRAMGTLYFFDTYVPMAKALGY